MSSQKATIILNDKLQSLIQEGERLRQYRTQDAADKRSINKICKRISQIKIMLRYLEADPQASDMNYIYQTVVNRIKCIENEKDRMVKNRAKKDEVTAFLKSMEHSKLKGQRKMMKELIQICG